MKLIQAYESNWAETEMKRSTALLAFIALAFTLSPASATSYEDITLYGSYGDSLGILIEGRVTEKRYSSEVEPNDSKWRNFWRNLSLFRNDERKGQSVTIQVSGATQTLATITSEEGYFKIEAAEKSGAAEGWNIFSVHSGTTTQTGQTLVVPKANTVGLISDLDDTILVTQVTSTAKMLANTFFKNPAQRKAVPGMAQLYEKLMMQNALPQAAPLFYLSASPHQLHANIAQFLAINRFPKGVLITKRVTSDKTSDPMMDQIAYKSQKLNEIFTRVPHVSFILVGDDGESDPEIYEAMRQKFPERVRAIWIRKVRTDRELAWPASVRDLAEVLREMKIELN